MKDASDDHQNLTYIQCCQSSRLDMHNIVSLFAIVLFYFFAKKLYSIKLLLNDIHINTNQNNSIFYFFFPSANNFQACILFEQVYPQKRVTKHVLIADGIKEIPLSTFLLIFVVFSWNHLYSQSI